MFSSLVGKSMFRLVYHTGTDFKHHDFECETALATEIVQKISNIMEMKSNVVRKEYLAHKEHKKRQNPFKRYSNVLWGERRRGAKRKREGEKERER